MYQLDLEAMIMASAYGNTKMQPPKLYKIHVVDEDGEEFFGEIGDVDFVQAWFSTAQEAQDEFNAAVDRDNMPQGRAYKPTKAYIIQAQGVTKICEEKTTVSKLTNGR